MGEGREGGREGVSEAFFCRSATAYNLLYFTENRVSCQLGTRYDSPREQCYLGRSTGELDGCSMLEKGCPAEAQESCPR